MVYEVIVDIGASDVDRIFDYGSPYTVPLGSRVLVPFGRRQVEGFVLGTKAHSEYEVKDIIMILDETPSIIPEMLELTKTLVKKYAFRYIDALRLFVPPKLRGGRVKVKTQDYYRPVAELTYQDAVVAIRSNAVKQKEILDYLYKEGETDGTTIRKSFSGVALAGLVQSGLIIREDREVSRIPYKRLEKKTKQVVLTDEQKEAISTIINSPDTRYLIHGVTGSGKTEVYLNVIEHFLQEGKTAIMLIPEISLTPQMVGLFRGRFGDTVGILHSGLSDGERYDEWRKILTGKARVALGARSAVFAPIKDIGVIIIDEEHDGSYISDREPRYTTEEIALLRARYNNAKLVLGSATPSLESYQRGVDGVTKLIKLRQRANGKHMPELRVVNMGDEMRRGNNGSFSAELLARLKETLDRGEQAMIFLNRRGYASFLECQSCGWVAHCPHCEIPLTYHKEAGALVCHYCGEKFRAVDVCPTCGHAHLSRGKKGTEKIVEELQSHFRGTAILRMDNDTTGTKDAYENILGAFSRGEAQILVGTQMIAKGHDFGNVTLVGIIDADQSLFLPDFRSVERTFQLITQVAGRAGREKKPGLVILQAFSTRHYVFRYAEFYDYEGFFAKESSLRKVTQFPPFSRMIRILVTSTWQAKAQDGAYTIHERLCKYKENNPGVIRIKFMNAPIARISDKYRSQVIILCTEESYDDVIDEVYAVTRAFNKEKKETVAYVDTNPQQMM